MPRLNSKTIDLSTLESRGDDAITVIKLAMAFNDLVIAGASLDYWKQETSPLWKDKYKNAQYYFVRLQMSHLFEAIDILSEVEASPGLLNYVSQCKALSIVSYHFLTDFLRNKSKRSDFERLVGTIRSNLVFHYNEKPSKLIKKALADRASRPEAKHSTIHRSDQNIGWHFDLGAEIIDSIIVREIWKIPRDADLREEADKKLEYIHEIFRHFIDFSSDFIWTYLSK